MFLDEDGNTINTDHDYELEWHIESGSEFVSVERSAEDPFSFSKTGLSRGSAEVHFELIVEHGGHPDGNGEGDHGDKITAFDSPDIMINAN